jgi:hypothetical protein
MPDKQVQTDGKRSAQSTLVPTITPPRSKSSTAYQRSQGTSSSISGVTIIHQDSMEGTTSIDPTDGDSKRFAGDKDEVKGPEQGPPEFVLAVSCPVEDGTAEEEQRGRQMDRT